MLSARADGIADLGLSITAAAVAALTVFIFKLVANRRHVWRLMAAKAPMPRYHPVLGHFLALKEAIEAFPRDATLHVAVSHLARQFANGVFYLDLWPFNETIMIVANPLVASQVEAAQLDKPAGISATMEIISGGPSIMTMTGSTWKKWRGLLSHGFAPSYMTSLAPAMAEEMNVFCGLLRDRARRGKVFQLEEHTLRLTFDIITRVTLDARINYQTQGSALADCLRRQVYWTSFGTTFNPFRRYLSPRPLVQWYNSYRMNRYLDGEIDKQFEELARSRRDQKGSQGSGRSVISLAMDKYLEEVDGTGELSKEAFKELAKPQIRMFLFAGHDTTSSTLLFCYLLLSRHPDVLCKVRTEHDQVFGTGYESCSQIIASDPTLLNQLPYTLAVIKEVLRLYPPAGSMREGRPDVVLTDEEGHRYPTDGCHIWTLTLAMHHSPEVFAKPEAFMPERWLVGPEDPLYPKKGAWRPFEWGPRNCIGQTLAQMELKVALAMTVRMFDIAPAYEEWDEMHPTKGLLKTVQGDRVYQAEMGGGGAHPVDGFPVTVTLRD